MINAHHQLHVGCSARTLIMELKLRQVLFYFGGIFTGFGLLRGSQSGVSFKVQIRLAFVLTSVQL